MQEKELAQLHRENYQPEPGSEHLVHYKIEQNVSFSPEGDRLSHPRLVKSGLKMFEMMKRNLEIQGYAVEILYHPKGKYTSTVIQDTPRVVRERLERESAEKDAEIEKLKAELAKARKKTDKKPEKTPAEKVESKEEK